MPTTLIVLAHPEPRSFNAAWARATADAAAALGHDVLWSDLYAQGFDPAEGPAHYPDHPAPFDPLKAQESGSMPPDIAAEVDKIRAADRIVLHFPIWWFAPPAMLKGWCDRALVHGVLHDVDHRFDTGHLRGHDVLFCVTTGADAVECGPDGKEGNWRLWLWPLAQSFRYFGMTVREPHAVHDVHGYHEGDKKHRLEARLADTLATQADLLRDWDARPTLPFNADADFDAAGRLRPGAPSVTPFIRRA